MFLNSVIHVWRKCNFWRCHRVWLCPHISGGMVMLNIGPPSHDRVVGLLVLYFGSPRVGDKLPSLKVFVVFFSPFIKSWDNFLKLASTASFHIDSYSSHTHTHESVSKSFRTGRLQRELQMVQFSATRCSCMAILWVSLVSFAAITLCVASQRVFIVAIVVYFVIDSVRKLLVTPS
jgi:hypothetical protein